MFKRGQGGGVERGVGRRGGEGGGGVGGEGAHEGAESGALGGAGGGDDGGLDGEGLLGEPEAEASLQLLEARLDLLYGVLTLRRHHNSLLPSLFHSKKSKEGDITLFRFVFITLSSISLFFFYSRQISYAVHSVTL